MPKDKRILPYTSPEGSIINSIERHSVFVLTEDRYVYAKNYLIVKGLDRWLKLPYIGGYQEDS